MKRMLRKNINKGQGEWMLELPKQKKEVAGKISGWKTMDARIREKSRNMWEWEPAARKLLPYLRSSMACAFFSAFLCGILAHGMMMFNKFSAHDDLHYLFEMGTTVTTGRWTLHILYWLHTLFFQDVPMSLPVLNGFIAILCIGLSAAMIVRMMRIQSRFLSAALGCLMVCFPTITGLFFYMFTIHYYMIALLGFVVIAWLLCEKKGWIVKTAAICAGAAFLGIYQGFLPILLGLFLLDGLRKLSRGEITPRSFWIEKGSQAFCTICMLGLYSAANRLLLLRLGESLSGYQGIGEIPTLSDIIFRTGIAYREFFLPTQGARWDMYPLRSRTMYWLMLAGDLVMSVRLLRNTARKSRVCAVLVGIHLLLLPLCCNLIFLTTDLIHGLMVYGQIIQILLFIWLLDQQEFRLPACRRSFALGSALILTVTGFLYIRLANQCYLKLAFEQQEAISYCTTLVTQIRASEDYRAERPVLFLNSGNIADPTLTHMSELDSVNIFYYYPDTREYLNMSRDRIMERWCGFTPVYYEGEDMTALPEVQSMPHYPDAGSIRIIHDILVVHF
jgi:hypothetical protein